MNHILSEIKQRMQIRQIPGISIRIAQKGKDIFQHDLGVSDLQTREALSDHHLFRMGCLTKPVIAYIILTLADTKRLKLTDFITDHLEMLSDSSSLRGITLSHLLCHSSGLARGDYPEKQEKDDKTLLKIRLTKRLFSPGQQYKYSNWGYFLLGKVIEKTTGHPVEKCIQDPAYIPTGMPNSTLTETDKYQRRLATGYWKGWRFGSANLATPSTPCPYTHLPACSGDLISNTKDYLSWLNTITTHSKTENSVQRCIQNNMFEFKQKKGRSKFSTHGLFAETIEGQTFYFFPGSSSGFSGFIFLIPDLQLTGIALCNHSTCNNELKDILYQICYQLLGNKVPNFGRKKTAINLSAIDQQGNTVTIQTRENKAPEASINHHKVALYPHSDASYFILHPKYQNHMLKISGLNKNSAKIKLGSQEFHQKKTPPVSNKRSRQADASFSGLYLYEPFGRLEIIQRESGLYLNYGVVYETLLISKTRLEFEQKSGPCRFETIQFEEDPETKKIVSFTLNGMIFKKIQTAKVNSPNIDQQRPFAIA